MWKKPWVRPIFIIWLIISAYVYNQHLITIRQYTIDKDIALKDIKIEIDEVTLENFNRKSVPNMELQRRQQFYKIALKLPRFF